MDKSAFEVSKGRVGCEMNDIRVYAQKQDFGRVVTLMFVKENKDGSFQVLGKTGFTDFAQGAYVESDKAVTITSEATQELMDRLWICGFRPSEGTGSAGQAAAMQEHIKDLRYGQQQLFKLLESKS